MKKFTLALCAFAALTVTITYTATAAPLLSIKYAKHRHLKTQPGDVPDIAPRTDIASANSPYSVKLADIDGDGKPDMIVANAGSNTISIYRNISEKGTVTAKSFGPKVDFVTGNKPVAICIGDIDGDGKPDIVVANYGEGTISILRNTSTEGGINAASFAAKVSFITGADPFSIAIADIDGDGKPDIAVTNFHSNTISIFRNTANRGKITIASFAAKLDVPTGFNPASIAIADIDGDNRPEMVVANAGGNNLSIYRNISKPGSITAASFENSVNLKTGIAPVFIAIGDLTGSGKNDIAVANKLSNSISVFRNISSSPGISSSTFAAKTDVATGASPNYVGIKDINNDGLPELLVTNYKKTSPVTMQSLNTLHHGISYNKPATDMFEQDQSVVNPVLSIYINSSAHNKSPVSFTHGVDLATGANPVSVDFGDIKGDGGFDILVSNFNDNSVSVFSSKPSLQTPPAIQSMVPDNSVVVHPAVSPNGDGINDVLLIDGIQNYPVNKLVIVTDKGQKIFEAVGYNNVTNAFNGHSSITGEMQKSGTYFYMLQ
jgi:hypothetical protein